MVGLLCTIHNKFEGRQTDGRIVRQTDPLKYNDSNTDPFWLEFTLKITMSDLNTNTCLPVNLLVLSLFFDIWYDIWYVFYVSKLFDKTRFTRFKKPQVWKSLTTVKDCTLITSNTNRAIVKNRQFNLKKILSLRQLQFSIHATTMNNQAMLSTLFMTRRDSITN